jgi:hypothetical protein
MHHIFFGVHPFGGRGGKVYMEIEVQKESRRVILIGVFNNREVAKRKSCSRSGKKTQLDRRDRFVLNRKQALGVSPNHLITMARSIQK